MTDKVGCIGVSTCQLTELDTLALQWALFWSCMWLQHAAITTCVEFLELSALVTEFGMTNWLNLETIRRGGTFDAGRVGVYTGAA